MAPAVDYLLSRPDVDARRIILAGQSFGAYHVLRAAAFERRVAAAIPWSPPYSATMLAGWAASWPPSFRDHLIHLFGATDESDLPATLARYDLAGVVTASPVRCWCCTPPRIGS